MRGQAGGESVRDLYRRAAEFLDELAANLDDDDDDAGDVVMVAHGGTVRVLAAYLHGIPADRMSWGPVGNAAITRVPDFRARLERSPSARSHLPVPQQLLHHSQGGTR